MCCDLLGNNFLGMGQQQSALQYQQMAYMQATGHTTSTLGQANVYYMHGFMNSLRPKDKLAEAKAWIKEHPYNPGVLNRWLQSRDSHI